MVTPDPALGITASFDADAFNRAILFAMQMGKPNDVTRQAVFVKKSEGRTYWLGDVQQDTATIRLDRDGRPFNADIRIEQTPDQDIAVDCAIEVVEANADEVPVGNFRPTKAVVTLLDAQYAQVMGCRELRYNADTYVYGYEPEADGLFDAGIHTMIFYALDES